MRARVLERREQGIAMVMVVVLGALLTLLGLTLIATVRSESDRSAHAVVRGTSFQAAEAGVDDYVAKLVEDPLYYAHYVHPAEAPREAPDGTIVAPSQAWGYDLAWTYPDPGAAAGKQLPNGYEYTLQITPPSEASPYVRIVSTGRKVGSSEDVRVVEALVRPSSLADFYRVVNGNVAWGAGATTNGKIYANGNVDHDGVATASIYAEGQITGSYTLQNGAQVYDRDSNPNIRSQIKNPINFANFLTSFVDIERASALGGIHLDDPTKAGWRLVFQADGTVSVQACTQTSGRDVADLAPTCGAATSYPVPANGAISTAQTAIVSGQVNGRVTIASNDDIVIGGDIGYVESGDDVLGLAAKNDVVIARWVPTNLTWMASVLAQGGTWKTFTSSTTHGTMTFTGSSATNLGGSMTMFATRNYDYDQALLFLPPPWFPTVEEAYTVTLFRELPASTGS